MGKVDLVSHDWSEMTLGSCRACEETGAAALRRLVFNLKARHFERQKKLSVES